MIKTSSRSGRALGGFAFAFSWFAFAACSSSSSGGGVGIFGGSDASVADGGSQTSDAPPRVWLASYLGAGSAGGPNDETHCPFTAQSDWILIGDPSTTTSIANGDIDSATGNTVNVSCSVVPETDGFHVEASAMLGVQGGVTISGHFTANTGTTLVLQNIDANFSRADTGSFVESTCTASYTSTPQQMGVAAGRVWADIDCTTATKSAQSETCEGKASFKFENCVQAP